MNYQEIRQDIHMKIETLQRRLDDPAVTPSESEMIRNMIDNYQYISELTEMNHYHRGLS
jgi:hypothetical protein